MPGRKIEVQLVGDASDLERSLAGALGALKAFGDGADKTGRRTSVFSKSTHDAERGLVDFDHAAAKVNKTMSGGPLNLFDAAGNVGYAILKLGAFAEKGTTALAGMFSTAEDGEGAMSSLGTTLSGLAPVIGAAAGGFVALGAALLVLPALAGAATFAFVALLDTVTILAALAAALAGPLAVLGALLGGLGVGFVLAGKRAIAGGGPFKEFAKTVKDLGKQFGGVVKTLGVDFLPLFDRLAGAAKTALTYLGQLAHMPLKQAFQSLSSTGVSMLSKFVYGVANVLKKPFKLAVQIAFGSGGGNAESALASWWDSLTKYLFGYTATHKIKLDGHVISIDKTQVAGALQPILKWFNSQHLVKTGIRWAHDIIDGLVRLWNHDKGLRDAVKTVLRDAGHMAAKAFKAAFFAEMHSIPWKSLGLYILHRLDFTRALESLARRAWSVIRANASGVLGSIAGWISSRLGRAWSAVKGAASSAWNAIKAKATGVWDSVVSYVEGHVPHPHINFGGILKTAEGVWDSIVSYIESHIPHPTIHLSIPTPSIPSGLRSLLPHTGGLVTNHGLAFAGGGIAYGGIPGRDSVPAMLTPGEVVLNRRQQLSLLKGGPGRGPVIVNVEISRREIAGIAQVEVIEGGKRTARTVKAGSKWGG